MSKRTIMFCFGGRRPNLELQLPFIYRILDENPGVEYHLWNLARDPDDYEWINSLRNDYPRILVVNSDGYSPEPWTRFTGVYKHYTAPKYADRRFVKMDDDVVFIETARFGDFIAAVDTNPHAVMSANVVNNGACTPLNPQANTLFRRMRLPLLNVHLSAPYAQSMHDWFVNDPKQMVGIPVQLMPTTDWLSINLIGYDYQMGRKLFALLDTVPPRIIAGRHFTPRNRVGDEGAVNMLPRIIVKGFTAGHLTFGPQEKKLPPSRWTDIRKQYGELGRTYLDGAL